MTTSAKVLLSTGSALLAALSGLYPAQAASGPNEPQAPAAATSSGRDEGDIIVTARRREERLQDVPVAATAFTSADLERYSTDSFKQVATQTPQLIISSTANPQGGVLNLRGIGSPNSSTTIDQAVSINIDGVQFSQANVLRLGLHDVGRVEVLKGPQALFYGKNSPAGIISIASAEPSQRLELKMRGGYEFANRLKFGEVTGSGPLTSTLGARLDAYFGTQSGWFRNDAVPVPAVAIPAALGGGTSGPGRGAAVRTGPDLDEYFGRFTLAYKPTSGLFDNTFKLSFGQEDQHNGYTASSQPFSCVGAGPQYAVAINSGTRDCKLDRYYSEADSTPRVVALAPDFFRDGRHYFETRQLLLSNSANFHPSDAITLSSITGYYTLREALSGNFSNGSLDFFDSATKIRIKQFSQELRVLTSFQSALNIMVGGYYQHIDNVSYNVLAVDDPLTRRFSGGALGGPQLLVNNRLAQKSDAPSLFGQIILDATPKLQITAGGRYSYEKKRIAGLSLPYAFNATMFQVPANPDHRSFRNFSPEATATFKASRDLTLYAAFRRGFVSGGFDLGASVVGFGTSKLGDLSYDQETVSGGELGIKGALADRQINFDVVIYDYDYKGLQISAFDATTLNFRVTNAGSARTKGAEFAVRVRPNQIHGLTLRAALAYNDARYGAFTNAPCYTGQTPAGGCAFFVSGAAGATTVVPIGAGQVGNAQDLSGRALVRSSKWAGNIGATLEVPTAGGMTFVASADEAYASPYFADLTDNPVSLQRETWRLNASLTVRGRDDRWSLSLVGTNLTQVLRASAAFGAAGTGGNTGRTTGFMPDEVGSVTEPRTVKLEATFKY